MTNLTTHFTLDELTVSYYALNNGLKNKPDARQVQNLIALAKTLEEVRTICGTALIITSAFRTATVNKGIGGQSGSAHLDGLAADFYPAGKSVFACAKLIEKHLPCFDQLILEFGHWIHIGIARGEALTYKSPGKVLLGIQR